MSGTILVVDDEKSIRITFKRFLEQEGYSVLSSADYESAISAVEAHEIDVICADIILGSHSGVDILKQIKERGLSTSVVMITGEPNIDTAAESVRLGAFDYVPKPVERPALVRIVAQALRHKQLLDEKQKLEENNLRYQHHLEAIFISVRDALITVDADMHIIEANPSAEKFLSAPPSACKGRHLIESVASMQNACRLVVEETLKTREPVFEYRTESRDDQHNTSVALLNSAPLFDGAGQFIGAVLVIRDITRLNTLERELSDRQRCHRLVGRNMKMQELYGMIETLGETEATVLIAGPSGTGKELVAEAIHHSSRRAQKPLVKVNCSALHENLLESELFGHVKGAFTGAVSDRKGRFEMAMGGTIFLDEIGDISPATQLRLLRVLQEKEFERLGSSEPIQTDVRIIAATNADLKQKVSEGMFREDLYYRLKVMVITLPPLCDRRDDIQLLINHFCSLLNKKYEKHITGVSDEVLSFCMSYEWPGNVRELEHVLEHAYIVCPGRVIAMEHLPPDISGSPALPQETADAEKSFTAEQLRAALDKCGWNKAKAARLLGVNRRTVYRKMARFDITDPHS
jgi:PAS domain S-box-containing protein